MRSTGSLTRRQARLIVDDDGLDSLIVGLDDYERGVKYGEFLGHGHAEIIEARELRGAYRALKKWVVKISK